MKLGIGVYFLYIAVGSVAFISIVLLYLFVKVFYKKEVKPINYKYTLGFSLKTLRIYGFLPFMCAFIASIEFWLDKNGIAFEYDFIDIGQVHYEYFGAVSILCAGILILMCQSQAIFLYDQFLTKAKSDLRARAHSKIHVVQEMSILIIVVTHFWIHESYPVSHLFIVFVLSLGLIGGYVYYLPFYNNIINYTHSAVFLTTG